jgi:hypothetical protein
MIMALTLYLIARQDADVDHDEVRSMVVAAPTAATARQMARTVEGDQSPEVWAPATATLTKIGTAAPRVKQGIVHMDKKSG